MIAEYSRYLLDFNFLARTSRGEMHDKETFFVRLSDPETGCCGVGECGVFRGLSAEDSPEYEAFLAQTCSDISFGRDIDLSGWSSIRYGIETASFALKNGGGDILFHSEFTQGQSSLPINGLVWMDTIERMSTQIDEKLRTGFKCIKLKIGQYDFDSELKLVDRLRRTYGPETIEIRLDANGAYDVETAARYLRRIALLDIHSVEQPIKSGQWEEMAWLCADTPQPIALDEELIGIEARGGDNLMKLMLTTIKPQYIVLKPSLCGGISGAEHWIELAKRCDIGWWVTSALESNIGLNALAQWTASLNPEMCQGLGTGMLYTNNFRSPLYISNGALHFRPEIDIDYSKLEWIDPR